MPVPEQKQVERELPEPEAIQEVCGFWRSVILPLARSLRPEMSRAAVGAIADRIWSAVHYEEVDGQRHPEVRVRGTKGACLAGTELDIHGDSPFVDEWTRFKRSLKYLRAWGGGSDGEHYGYNKPDHAMTALVAALETVLRKDGIADGAVARSRGRG